MEVLGLFYFPTWLFYIIALISLYFVYFTWNSDHFKKRGIDGPRPIPPFGTMLGMFKKGAIPYLKEEYQQYKDKGVYGVFQGRTPAYVFTNPDHVKEIFVKQFNNFVNRRRRDVMGKPLDLMLTMLRDDHWKYVRNTITPAFSGNKLRRMTRLINEAADSLLATLQKKAKNDEDIELKLHFGAYTMDVISSTSFGIKIDTQNDPDNPLVASAKKFMNVSLTSPLVIIMIFFPFLTFTLKYLRRTKELSEIFIDVTKENIQFRKDNPSNYVDFLQLMLNTRKTDDSDDEEEKTAKNNDDSHPDAAMSYREKGLDDDEILAQAILFYTAGYETTANALTYTMYNLAVNQDCCEKATQEVDSVLGKNKPNYDTVNALPYLDMCISETLRLYPLATFVEREACHDTVVGGITIPRGTIVQANAIGFHYDSQYWEDPEKYDPERFTAENKAKRNPFVYMPFGHGPRNCIGMRLAQVEAKIALAVVLQHFKPVVCEKTKIPLEHPKLGFQVPEEGVWIKLQSRDNE